MGFSGVAADACANIATGAAKVANRKQRLLVTWTSLGMRNDFYQPTLLRPKKFRETSTRGARLWLAKVVKSASRPDHGVGPRTRASALGCGLVWLSSWTVHYLSRPCPGVFSVVYDHLSAHQYIFDAFGKDRWFKIGRTV